MSEKLSLLDNSSDSEVELTVNKDYAKNYNRFRNFEELRRYRKLKNDEKDSESSSESDEEIPEFDEEFFRALSLLKGKDARLYNKDFELFEKKEVVEKPKTVKQKPLFMKDYKRKLVLEKGVVSSDEDDETSIPEKIPTYDEQQEKLKKSFKEALENSNESDDDDDGYDLLQVRKKTEKEQEAEDDDYVKWLKGDEKDVSEDVKKDMSYLRNYWNDPNLDGNEKFLRDYILNKGYIEKDDSNIPTYEELVSGRLSDDERMIDKQDAFEHKYNFRFEEPDDEFIKRYPRTIGDSLRRTDNKRKQKRKEKAERKRKEREQRTEELKRLKALKKKDIEEKFMKLKEISGRDEINMNESDIESDFDPDKHEKKMREMFNDDYYQVKEDKKPEFPYDEELDSENWNAWAGEKIVDDDDVDEIESTNEIANESTIKENGESSAEKNFKEKFADEMVNAFRPKKRVRKKSLFAKIISHPKPIYDPDGKSFEEYLDEYYKLDYEDVVGDIPVRYRYRKVIPNDFGLSVDEILEADDKELNRWCSIRKTYQYRNDDEEFNDVQLYSKKSQKPSIKKKFLPSIYAPKETDSFIEDSNYEMNILGNNSIEQMEQDSTAQKLSKKKSKKHKIEQISSNTEEIDSTEFNHNDNVQQLEQNSATQIQPKKKSKKRKLEQDSSVAENNNSLQFDNSVQDSTAQIHSENKLTEGELVQDSSVAENNNSLQFNNSVQDSTAQIHSENKLKEEELVHDISAAKEERSAGEPLKKKKNKRRRNYASNNSDNNAKPFPYKLNVRCKQLASEDKRLSLPNERLAAYGVNPKKFKKGIIYARK